MPPNSCKALAASSVPAPALAASGKMGRRGEGTPWIRAWRVTAACQRPPIPQVQTKPWKGLRS